MTYADFLNVMPSALSAVASIAASIAAFKSLKISRESAIVAEQSALAINHGPAIHSLTEALELLSKKLEPLSSLSFDIWVEWSREIEEHDLPGTGGCDPRPLRHVLANSSDILEKYATQDAINFQNAKRKMYSIIRDGMGKTSDEEYSRLLKFADRTYTDFESTFGNPRFDKPITSAKAFRWTYYQLSKRVEVKTWRGIWANAWKTNGWLQKYRDEYLKIEALLGRALESLKAERTRLAHSVFPLETNPELYAKYKRTIAILEELIEIDGLNIWEGYIEKPHDADLILLVLYSMGVSIFTHNAIEALQHEL